ncbi:efflux transporter outer membrane subunit [Sphingomonas montanisoli]|uniref:Efflux transporter outer membrane subunit n=1 Tax=Sphingomonas montanisoli TaxID=2606412 RepID=A0A5D9C304_9SPHN|nr:efflux transporter outer membrane subunit [Sphingomonas montanisoli]TZG25916.1 efflux transporter outer membrane subunit [Sphingomonas montanisoli]
MKSFVGGAALAALLLAGCAPRGITPALKPIGAPDVGLTGGVAGVPVAVDWWKALGDPQLDRIMADALSGSPTLAGAMARMRIAQAGIETARAGTLPSVSVSAQEQRTRLPENYIIPPPFGGSSQWVGNAAANVSWSLDFFGRQKAALDEAKASADAASLDAAAARLALSSAVAQTYVELARAEQQTRVAADFVTARQRSVTLIQSRIRNQLSSNFEARAAETLLAQARQAELRARAQRETIVHALAALAGRGADYYATVGTTALAFDRAVPLPTALPADLLGRRPDLLAGQARIAAASAGRQVAKKAFYPNINLLGMFGFQALGLGNITEWGSRTYGAGPSLSLPIFEGGRLTADYKRATGQVDVAIADYNDSVVRAIRDTADAIALVRANQGDAAEQANVLTGLQDVVRLDRTRIQTGLASQLDILESDTRLLAARQGQIDLAADGAIRRIQLVAAIGGDFAPTPALAVATQTPTEAQP